MKKLFLFTYLTIIFTWSQTAMAQFPVDGSYQSISPSVLNMPAIYDTVIDYTVPSPIAITRITEYYQPWDWYPIHEYAKTQIWNADQSLYRIRSWKVYDANTHQEVQNLSGAVYPSYWSNTDPDLIWSFQENGDIKKHLISTNTTQTVDNITTALGTTYEYVKLGPGEGNIDNNDQYIALVGKDGLDMDVIIYDLQALQIVHRRKFVGCWQNGGSSFPHYVDWVSVSQSGNYVVIMWNHNTTSQGNPYIENGNSHYGVEVYNTTDMVYQNRIITYGNHGDLGFASDGDEVLVQFYGLFGGGTLYMHKLNGTGSTVLQTHSDFGVAGHVSCRNTNRPGWAYVTHSLVGESGQMVAVKLDNSGIVEHFGHHFSSGTSYDQAAMAVASPDGDKICFKSDFGTGPNTNPSIVYSFFANLAEVSYDTLSITNCNTYTAPSGNYTWTSTGTYYDTIPNALGYDSLLTINLTIFPSTFGNDTRTECDSLTWIDGVTYYSDTNNVSYTIPGGNANGCDSIVTLSLTIETVNTTITTSNYPSLTADIFGASYQWLDCQSNFSIINGETNQTYTPTNNGEYAVEITNNTCVDTSSCYSIEGLGLLNHNNISINVLPNPNNGQFSISNLYQNSIIQIYTVDGKKVFERSNNNSETLEINLNDLKKGMYFVKIINDLNYKTIQFLKY